jgi:hypothetical protein
MGPLLIASAVLIVAAGVLVFLARRSSRRVAAISAAETTTCAQVNADLNPSAEAIVELIGQAQPAAEGVLVAPFSNQRCVWYRSKLTRRYWEWRTVRSEGRERRQRSEHDEVVYDKTSGAPFLLQDKTGRVVIDPTDARVDKPGQVRNRFERESDSFLLNLGLGPFSRGQTIGFRREEWVIVPNERLYVLGAAVWDRGSADAVLVKPRSGHRELLISTRSEEQLLRAGRWKTGLFYVGAVLAAVASVACLVVALTR